MKIGIDARWIFPQISGIGRVTEKLIWHLGAIDRENRYVLFFSDPEVEEKYRRAWADFPNLETVLVPWGVFSPAGQLGLPRALVRLGLDVFHSTNYLIPLRGRGLRMIVTIHDLIPLKFPHFTPRAKKTRFNFLFRWVLLRCVRRADRVIAVSRCTRDDLRTCLGIPEEKITVVYNGLDDKYRPLPPGTVEKSGRGDLDPGPFVLFIGRLDPYKNLVGLLRAFRLFLARSRSDARLVIGSHRDPRYPEVFETITALGLNSRVVFLDRLEEEDIIFLYRHARMLVLPSLYEGFGLPPLEAMACGTPVICSDRGALPEVVGDAALVVPPEPEAIARGIERVWRDEALRSELREKGLNRSREFSWEKTAREHLAVYRSLLSVRSDR